jgi:hypothetical protein
MDIFYFYIEPINLPEDPVFGTPDKSWKQIFFLNYLTGVLNA